MIRYVLKFPPEVPQWEIEEMIKRWNAAASRREAIDVAVSAGVIVQPLYARRVPPTVRRAWALHR